MTYDFESPLKNRLSCEEQLAVVAYIDKKARQLLPSNGTVIISEQKGGSIRLSGRDKKGRSCTLLEIGDIQALKFLVAYWYPYQKSFSSPENIPNSRIPHRAEKLLYLFLDPKATDGLIGDLAEEFQEIAKKHGEKFAVRWYWWQTLSSIGPIIYTRLTKLAKKTAIVAGLAKAYDWVRQLISS